MKKTLLITLVISVMLLNFTIPASAWSWKDDGHFEVAEYWVYIAEQGEIIVDGELDEAYLQSTRIESYKDDVPYKRGGYETVWDDADGTFFAYIVVDVTGMFIYAEINDTTIFETTNTNGNDGDCFQIYFDWCTPDIAHPRPNRLYDMYLLDGVGWAYGPYKSTYGAAGLQYLGWLSCDYNGVISSSMGFNPHTALGPEGTDSVLLETKLIDGGWACEWFVPWRDDEQKEMVADDVQFPCGIGFQACDDADIDNLCTPDKEENSFIKFDQRNELGLSYWADYSMLADVFWADDPICDWPIFVDEIPGVDTSDSAVATVIALVASGAGIVVFSKKKKDR